MNRFFYLSLIFTIQFILLNHLSAQVELEPNNEPPQANWIFENSMVSGALVDTTSASSEWDAFITQTSDDGTLKLKYSFSNGSQASDIRVRIYPKTASSFGNGFLLTQAHNNTASITDSILLYCLEQDTFLITISCGHCDNLSIDYQLSYSIEQSLFPKEPEPNDDFDEAVEFANGDTVQARLGYGSVAFQDDKKDYFYSVLPADGQLRLYVNYHNLSDPNGASMADFYTRIHKKNYLLFASSLKLDNPIGLTKDTLIADCVQGDTVFFHFTTSNGSTTNPGCFAYEFYYEVIPNPGPNDIEPNDEREIATLVSITDTLHGHLGYEGGSPDRDTWDYYKFYNDDENTLELSIQLHNTSTIDEKSFAIQTLKSNFASLGTNTFKDLPPGLTDTSLSLICYPQDTLIMGFRSESGCHNYTISINKISCSTGIHENLFGDVNIYPNPIDDHVMIEGFPLGSSIFIKDILGRRVEVNSDILSPDKMKLSFPEMPVGILFLEIHIKEGMYQTKLLTH